MNATFFDDLTEVYEALIDWPKRLANEEPFYRRWFERFAVRSVADAACGIGRHAAMFHAWGLRVEGADLSPGMIQRARAQFGKGQGPQFVVRGFDRPAEPAGSFDAALCVGNSLALAADLATVERAAQAMFATVRPGGLVIAQVLNLWKLPDGPCLWQKCKRAGLPQGEAILVKGVHRCGGRGYVDLVVTSPAGDHLHSESVPFLGLEAVELEQFARHAGADWIEWFGGYQDQPHDRLTSVDLVMVARKATI